MRHHLVYDMRLCRKYLESSEWRSAYCCLSVMVADMLDFMALQSRTVFTVGHGVMLVSQRN